MKAWVLKTKKGKYVDSLEETIDSRLNMATLWSTKRAALREGLNPFNTFDVFPEDLPKVKAVKVEIKEVK